MPTVSLACRCGTVRGTLDHVGSVGNHAVCYCIDCQTWAHHLGRDDLLDDHGGTSVYTSRPSAMRITEGHAHLACVRLGPNGTFRWVARCCDTPVANVSANARVPFVGVPVAFFAESDAAPPVHVRVMGQYAHGAPSGTHPRLPPAMALRTGLRFAVDFVRGHHRPSPFASDDGSPLAEPVVLTRAERAAAREKAERPPRRA
jgi:hypothetical protein